MTIQAVRGTRLSVLKMRMKSLAVLPVFKIRIAPIGVPIAPAVPAACVIRRPMPVALNSRRSALKPIGVSTAPNVTQTSTAMTPTNPSVMAIGASLVSKVRMKGVGANNRSAVMAVPDVVVLPV